MKEFFLEILNSLDKLTGLKQMEKLGAMPDPKKEVNELLDILCRVSSQFPLIPKEDQKKIVRQAVISDPELTSLNARIVYKWLNTYRDKYFKEAAHIPEEQDPNWKPLEGTERQKKLNEWMESLSKIESKVITKSHVKTWEETLPRKNENAYPSTKAEDVLKAELHLQWIRENHDRDGNPLPTYVEEEIWLKNKVKNIS